MIRRAHATLVKAKALISDPAHRTCHAYARSASGAVVSPSDDEATRWCALGALRRVSNTNELGDVDLCLVRAAQELFRITAVRVNDERSHEDNMLMWDRAILLAEKDLMEVTKA